MKKKSMIRNLTKGLAVMGCCLLVNGFTACSDQWDEHYEESATGISGGSLWEAISSNAELSNFKTVLEAVGYDKQLASSQKFTVFAPTNAALSETQAQAFIDQYKAEKGKVSDDDNQMLKEFVKNHVALYNYSVSSVSDDSIRLMNGKYGVLTSNSIAGVPLLTKNQNYQNGVLYTVGSQLSYKPNIFECFRQDADLDSLESFFYNKKFYYKEFQPSLSVEGGLDEMGRTIYLDSVFSQQNDLFAYSDYIDSEDSLFWMVAPTNILWDQLLTEYQEYFKYADDCQVKDSLEYLIPRLAIIRGTVFSGTFNDGVFNQENAGETGDGDIAIADSAMSVSCIRDYIRRKNYWGQPFNYYEYYNAWQTGGVFQETNTVDTCSNGLLRKATSSWPIDKLQSFHQYIIVEADASGNVWEMSKSVNAQGDSINTIKSIQREVAADTSEVTNFYGKVWGNSFVEFEPVQNSLNHFVTFRIDNVLSNLGYDIYVVTAPARAYDKNATEKQRVPTKLRSTLYWKDTNGKQKSQQYSVVETKADSMTYIKVVEDFKFPTTNYGLSNLESKPSVTLKVETRVSNKDLNAGTYTRTMRIDCILLVPHGTLVEGVLPASSKIPAKDQGKEAILMKPHGDTPQANTFYMLR